MKYGRTLVVDTRVDTVVGDVLRLLTPRERVPLGNPASRRHTAPVWLSTSSSHVEEFHASSDDVRNPENYDFLDRSSTTFAENVDLGEDHPHRVLFHEQAGGGFASWNTLHRLTLREEARTGIGEMLPPLPRRYDAVHIRGTDYSPLTSHLLERLNRSRLKVPLLVCSDSNEVLNLVSEKLCRRQVITFPPHGVPDNRPLHSNRAFPDSFQRHRAAIGLLAELNALAGARRFYFGTVASPYEQDQHVSGLSTLVLYLVSNRKVSREIFGRDLVPPGFKTFSRSRLVAVDYTQLQFWWGIRKNSFLHRLSRIRELLALS